MGVTRILIADDHPVVRHGIRQILSTADDMAVSGEAADGREVLALAQTVEHDLVLLDLSMPDSHGLDVLKQLRRDRPKVPVLILTIHPEDQYAVRALRSGAAGYLMKESTPVELIAAVRKVIGGGRYVSSSLAERLAGHLADNDAPAHEKLSDREFQVLRMIAAGKSTRQIAVELGLSIKTVSTYRARVYDKLQLRTPSALAAYAVRNRVAD